MIVLGLQPLCRVKLSLLDVLVQMSILSEKTNTAFFVVEYQKTLHFSLALTVELIFVEFLHNATSE